MVPPGFFNLLFLFFFRQVRNLAALGESLLAKEGGDLTRAKGKIIEQ